MMYRVQFSDDALKEFEKLDRQTARIIDNWIIKNLIDTTNPRQHGKALKGNLKGIWRYRVGDYKLLAEIHDNILLIFIFEKAHRRDIYKR